MFKKIFNAIMYSKQASANREIAKILSRIEYRQEDPEYILHKIINQK